MKHTKEEWVVIDSGGRVMLKATGEPQIICTLEKALLKRTPKIAARARLIATAPDLLGVCKGMVKHFKLSEMTTPQHLMLKHTENAIAKAEGK